jgi:hypothetical protein
VNEEYQPGEIRESRVWYSVQWCACMQHAHSVSSNLQYLLLLIYLKPFMACAIFFG